MFAFFVVAALTYLNTIGLPGFLKRPLLAELHDRGLDLQFDRLRWRWYRGLVADRLHVGAAQQETDSPRLSIQQLELKVNHHALVRFKLQIDSVTLHGGKLVWPLDETNQPSAALSMTNIQTQLRFLPGDQWALDHFTAAFAGAKLQLSGSLTNASAVRDWKFLRGRGGAQPELLRARLRELSRIIDRIQFDQPPEINVSIHGDARDLRTVNGQLTLDAPGAITPWGILTNGTLVVRLTAPTGTNAYPVVKFQLHTDDVKFVWHSNSTETLAGGMKHFYLDLDAFVDEEKTNLIQANLDVTAAKLTMPWGHAANARFNARWTHALTNAVPIAGKGELKITDATTRWGTVEELLLDGRLDMPVNSHPSQANPGWAWWASLEPYFLDWNCNVKKVHAGDFESALVVCGGKWRAPELTITNLHTEMYQGRFDANAILNVATRLASFVCTSDFDAQKISPLLTKGAREWIENQQFSWDKPPLFHWTGSVRLPAWTNSHPDWRGEVLPSLSLAGDFQVGPAGYHQIPVLSAQSHIFYTNMTWNLPDLVAIRPEGKVELVHVSDDVTKDFYFRVRSTADVKMVRHLLATNAQRGLDFFDFSQPPLVEAEVWGRWRDRDRIGFKGRMTVTNFSFRGETATLFHSTFEYTNRFILLKDGRIERTNEYLTASALGIDFTSKQGFLTNGFSNMDPLPILHVIGPKVTKDMEPYHFLKSPIVRVDGVIPLTSDTSVADMRFNVDGGPFEWLKFHVPRITGTVHWAGVHMTMNDMHADFYGGKLSGSAGFDFTRNAGTDFHFDSILTGANLHALMADLTRGSNHLEGLLNGHLDITQADSVDPHSWLGKGQVDLHDGLIWDIPMFGILSPVLDSISPGLGKTRASEGAGTFTITNSIMHSDDLEIRSPAIRLLYRGSVNLVDKTADAVVEAEVGRDTPLVGPVVGILFSPFGKLFETRVTGTLNNPKREAVVPFIRWLSPIMHPFRTLKDLKPEENPTFAPVVPQQQPSNLQPK